MSFHPKLSSFEGPMDLLVHLIEKNKIDIYDIPIAQITDQYMEFLYDADESDADFLSEFLVMAATLMEIKSRMLLPADEEEEEEDPRAVLTERLLEYKLYKYMSLELKEKETLAGKSMYRKQALPEEIAAYSPPVDYGVLLEGVGVDRLSEAFRDVMARYEGAINEEAKRYGKIKKEPVSIPKRMDEIRTSLKKNGKCTFRNLIEKEITKENMIVTFLSVLELMKAGEITGRQNKDEIELEWVKAR